LQLAEREPSAEERRAFAGLAEHCRAEQLGHIADLGERYGEGPALREARRRIEAGELLAAYDASRLKLSAADDERSRAEQERLAFDYLAWRDRAAQRRHKFQKLPARLRSAPEDFLDQIDRRSLRRCRSCQEIAYPDPERGRYERAPSNVAFRCHFCGGTALAELGEEGGER